MTAKNRAGLIGKLQTLLKKHYKSAPPSPGRPLLEHVLYGALLEESPADLADEGYAKCEQEFFDWNEVRVTSVTELAEVLAHLPSSTSTAIRLKRCLQGVFETFYTFDIDHLKKENLGKAVAKFESMPGVTPFVLNHVVQHGLGGHAIPVNAVAMKIMLHVGIVTTQEARSGKVPGLERAIPKNRAIEFSSTLHQAAIQFALDPLDQQIHELVRAINPDAVLPTAESEASRKSSRRAGSKRGTGTPASSPRSAPATPTPGTSSARDIKKSANAGSNTTDKKASTTAGKAAKAKSSQAVPSQPAKDASVKAPAKAKSTDGATATRTSAVKKGGQAKAVDESPSDKANPDTDKSLRAAGAPGKLSKTSPKVSADSAKPKPSTSSPAAKAKAAPPAKSGTTPTPTAPKSKKSANDKEPVTKKDKAQAADAATAEAGNQKLTKRKPR